MARTTKEILSDGRAMLSDRDLPAILGDDRYALYRNVVDELAKRGARYFSADPSIARFLEQLGEKDGSYLAHEYLNEHWDAFYHLDVAREMAEAQLEYVGSATVCDNIIGLSAPPEIAAMFAGADPGMAETIKDFSVNRRFRRDLFGRVVAMREHHGALGTEREQ